MNARWMMAAVAAGTLGAAGTASAQTIVVQQPVMGVTSVATTVSVPDRGSMLLGSVSRSGEFRSTTGPLRSGTAYGAFREHSSMRVNVYIHDFEEMDRRLLGAPRPPAEPPLDGLAGHAYRSLLAREKRR